MARRTNLISAILGGVGGGIEAGLEQRERTLSAREREAERKREAERLAQQTARQGQLDIAAMADKPGWTTPEARTTALRGAAPGLQEVLGMVPGMMGREAPRGLSEAGQAALSQAAGQFGAPAARVTLGGQEFLQTETPTQRAMREAAATAGQERRKAQEATQAKRAEEARQAAAKEAERQAMVESLVAAGISRAQAEAASRTGARFADVIDTPSVIATKRGQDISAEIARLNREATTARAAAGGAGRAPSALQQMMTSRVEVAKRQSRTAHDEMVKFENELISGARKPISATEATAASYAFSGGELSKYAEGWLNKNNPDLARYIRNAKAIGASERLVMPRGGSNLLMNLETALAGVGPGASPDLIRTTQQFRAGLVEGLEQETGESLLESDTAYLESALGSPEDRATQPGQAETESAKDARRADRWDAIKAQNPTLSDEEITARVMREIP